ncbi:hypothetical protein BVY01_01825 [bacterium I07]|nr:hypothetical protein BVY01_01825 [bacterium I07]
MKKILAILVFSMFYLIRIPSAHTQVGMKKLGQSTMNFLKIGVSPKAAAMGNAYVSMGNDVESVFYNPAGLAAITSGFNAFASHTQWIADINYTAGALAKSFGNFGTFAVSVLAVDYGDIQGADLVSGTDAKGYVETGNIDVGAYAFGLAYARPISNRFSMGGQIQYVGQKLGDAEAATGMTENTINKLTFNFGIRFQTGVKDFTFAMAIRNFATQAKYEEVTAQLPLIFIVGSSIDLLQFFSNDSRDSFLISAEFLHPNNYTERVNVGGQYSFMGLVSLRAGYEFNRDLAGLSAGIGLGHTIGGKRMEINYSYSDFDFFDGVNRLAVNITF